MGKKIGKAAVKYIEFVKRVAIAAIQPFRKKPFVEWQDPASGTRPRERQLAASDLFSIFPTDITRGKMTFTR